MRWGGKGPLVRCFGSVFSSLGISTCANAVHDAVVYTKFECSENEYDDLADNLWSVVFVVEWDLIIS